MSYIYDILLNFQKEFYDFYDWNSSDEILHIRKIPIIKVNNKDFNIIKNSVVRFSSNFLYKIQNKAEKFSKAKTNSLDYVFLVSSGVETMGLKLNKKGLNTYKSSLLIDENEEVSEIASNLEIDNIDYKIIKNCKEINFKTRKEREMQNIIINNLNRLYNNNEEEKLKFLYLDCFNKKEKNVDKIFKCLKEETLNDNKNCEKIYDFFKLV